MYYLDLDDRGYLKGYFTVDTPTEAISEDSPLAGIPAVESLEGLDLSGHRIRAYHWDGEKLVLDEDKLAALDAEEQATQAAGKIAELKKQLTSTDYVVIKIAEGAATAEEYADVIVQRQAWRDEINRLEAGT